MSLTFAIAIYFIVWWLTLFAVLPFNIHTQDEAGEIVPGTPGSAPAKHQMLKIVAINTVIASLVFALVWSIIVFQWIDLDFMKLQQQSPV